jgi:hypothetical protein
MYYVALYLSISMPLQIFAIIGTLVLGIPPLCSWLKKIPIVKNVLKDDNVIYILMVLIALAGIVKVVVDDQTSTTNETSLKQANTKLDQTDIKLKQANTKLDKLGKASLTCGSPKNGAAEIGFACERLNKIYEKPKSRKSKIGNPIKVEYFLKEANSGKTPADIRYLGFETKPSEGKNDKVTNTIWYSPDIDPDDVKDIAYTLIATGIKLKRIVVVPKTKGFIQIGNVPNCGKDYWKVKEISNGKRETSDGRKVFDGENKTHNCP